MNATAEGEDEGDVMFIRAALHDAYIVIKNKTRVCVCVSFSLSFSHFTR